MAGLIETVKTLLQRARRKDRRIQRREQLHSRRRRADVRIAAQIMIGQHVVPERVRILRAEPASPVVAIATELRRPALRLELAGVGAKTKVATADELRRCACDVSFVSTP